MKPSISGTADDAFFSVSRVEETAWINLQKNLLIRGIRLSSRDALLSCLDELASDQTIKVIVLRSLLEESGHREYLEFFRMIRNGSHDLDLHRLCNVYASLIVKLTTLNKMVIHVTSGNVIPLFLNLSLACDHRIAADTTIYRNSYLDTGLLPIGGGPYFLSRLLGASKALELMVLKKQYTASEALSSGIIDRIIPENDLESETLETARCFAAVPAATLTGLKRLLHFSTTDLQAYLEFENREIFKTIFNPAFRSGPKMRV